MPESSRDNCQVCDVRIEDGKLVSHIEDYHVGPKHQEGIVITCGYSGCPYTVTLTDSGLERMIRHCNATRHDPTGMKINWDSFFNSENKRLRELVKFGVQMGGDRQMIKAPETARVPATPNYRRRSEEVRRVRRSPPARFVRPSPPVRPNPSPAVQPEKRARWTEETPRRRELAPKPMAQRRSPNESSMSELEDSLAVSTFAKERSVAADALRPQDPVPTVERKVPISSRLSPNEIMKPSSTQNQLSPVEKEEARPIKEELADPSESQLPTGDESQVANTLEKELAGIAEDGAQGAGSALKLDKVACTFCSYSASGTNLRPRMVDHVFSHDRGLTPFKCRTCEYVTTRTSSIERHAKSDTNNCDGSFDNIQTTEMIRRTRILLSQAFPEAGWESFAPPRGQIGRIKLNIED